jgi:iron complex transport system substrate-binding protein
MTLHRTRRRLAALVAVLALASLLAACGSDGDTKSDAAATEDTTAAADAGPVTITHHYGETEVKEVPKRIVALDLQWTDVLVALGAQPIAFAGSPQADPKTGRYAWQTDLSQDAEMLDVGAGELPFEKVAALRPDLIVVTYGAQDKAAYDKLSAIAPTIPMLTDRQVDRWQDIATAAGKVLHKEDEAAALIQQVDDDVKQVGVDIPTLKGKTFTLAQYIPGDAIYVVADKNDGSSVFFQDLGLVMYGPVEQAGKDQGQARPTFSGEHVDILSADFVAFFNGGDDATLKQDLPGFDQLPSVRSGAMKMADFGLIVALNTPTPTSIEYALQELRPNLEAAAK